GELPPARSRSRSGGLCWSRWKGGPTFPNNGWGAILLAALLAGLQIQGPPFAVRLDACWPLTGRGPQGLGECHNPPGTRSFGPARITARHRRAKRGLAAGSSAGERACELRAHAPRAAVADPGGGRDHDGGG